jgi:ketosteroid isomerase-like protein
MTDPMANRPSRDASPKEVWEFTMWLEEHGYDNAWADMFSTDAVFEIPLAPPGMRNRLEGREEIRATVAPAQRAAHQLLRTTTTDVRLHQTGDPEVIVCEFTSHKEVIATGEVAHVPYVHVVRVRDGEIVSKRDYASFELMPKLSLKTMEDPQHA